MLVESQTLPNILLLVQLMNIKLQMLVELTLLGQQFLEMLVRMQLSLTQQGELLVMLIEQQQQQQVET